MNTFFNKLATAPFFLAQGAAETIAEEPAAVTSPRTRFIWVGAILLGFLILAIILIVIVSRSNRRSRRHSRHTSSSTPSPDQSGHRRHKHRKRRHSHQEFPQNPTLSETGGLPPPRPEGQPPRF